MTSQHGSTERQQCPHLNVCLTALVRRSMIFTRSSLEQVSSSVRSWFRSSDVTRPSSSSSRTMVSALTSECETQRSETSCSVPRRSKAETATSVRADRDCTANQNAIQRSRSPDVPESDLLVKVSAHDALLCAHNVIAAGASKHRLHTCAGETGSQ